VTPGPDRPIAGRPVPVRAVFVAAVIGLAAPAAAQDVLVLTNGDRISGRLVAIAGDTWTFSHAGGDLRIGAGDIASYASAGPIGVRLADGTVAAGRISVADGSMRFTGADGAIRPLTVAGLAAVGSADDLHALLPVRVGFLSPLDRFWRADLAAGFAHTSGNSRSQGFSGDVTVERRTAKDRLALAVGGAAEWAGDPADLQGDLVKVVEKYYGSARLDVFVSPAVFLFGGTLQEIDEFQAIDLRSNYSAGLGLQVIATAPTDLRFDLSGGMRMENFTPAAGDTTVTTAIASAGSQLRQHVGPLVLNWGLRWTPAVEDLQDYRFLSEAAVTTTLFRGLGFRIGSRNEFNNNPPAGIEQHDWRLSFQLTYTTGG
jgi:putative salt-induced outer membrane protein YdiY